MILNAESYSNGLESITAQLLGGDRPNLMYSPGPVLCPLSGPDLGPGPELDNKQFFSDDYYENDPFLVVLGSHLSHEFKGLELS